jgi:hypothetical protein
MYTWKTYWDKINTCCTFRVQANQFYCQQCRSLRKEAPVSSASEEKCMYARAASFCWDPRAEVLL